MITLATLWQQFCAQQLQPGDKVTLGDMVLEVERVWTTQQMKRLQGKRYSSTTENLAQRTAAYMKDKYS